MAHKIQIKRGNKADLPTLDAGEFGLCQDTNELFIGNNGNQKIFPPTVPDFPSSLPANGGNSDTVDNKHIWVGAEGSKGTDANTIYFCY